MIVVMVFLFKWLRLSVLLQCCFWWVNWIVFLSCVSVLVLCQWNWYKMKKIKKNLSNKYGKWNDTECRRQHHMFCLIRLATCLYLFYIYYFDVVSSIVHAIQSLIFFSYVARLAKGSKYLRNFGTLLLGDI